MYPNLFYACRDLFGVDWPFVQAIHSVGFLMALAFLPGAWLWSSELKRKERIGELTYRVEKLRRNKLSDYAAVLLHSLLGFYTAYKLVGLLLEKGIADVPGYLFSTKGNLVAGLITGLTWGGFTLYSLLKPGDEKQNNLEQRIYPHEYVPRGILVAALSGVVGSKLAGILENPGQWLQSPVKTLFSGNGFAFFGGLITATFAMWFYHYKFTIQRMRMADALAPCLMLSYAIGRLGCHVGGDGDWGINNLHPKPFTWLPDWLWAWDYPHNVLRAGNYINGCNWDDYCTRLAVPVYPTPLYECIFGLLLFALMMFMRNRLTRAGQMSALYLMLAGAERFLIEQIRIDTKYLFAGIQFTQAELLSVFLIIAGIVLWKITPILNANKHRLVPAINIA